MNINQIFDVYNENMSKIYSELYLIKESANSSEYNLLLEGFWDKVKNGAKNAIKNVAGSIGSAVGSLKNKGEEFQTKAADTKAAIANKGTELRNKAADKKADISHGIASTYNDLKGKATDFYNRGKELGNKAIAYGKELVNNVVEWCRKEISYIKKSPEIAAEILFNLFEKIKTNCLELYTEAKAKGGKWLEEAKATIKTIYKKVATKMVYIYSFVKKWIINNADKANTFINKVDDKIQILGGQMEDGVLDTVETIVNFFKEKWPIVKKNSKELAKYAGLVALGIIVLPFLILGAALKKTKEIGEDAVIFTQEGILTIKRLLGKSWDLAIQSYKEGEESKRMSRFGDKQWYDKTDLYTVGNIKRNLDEFDVEEGFLIKDFSKFNYITEGVEHKFADKVYRKAISSVLSDDEYNNDAFYDNILHWAIKYCDKKKGNVSDDDVDACIAGMKDNLDKLRLKEKAKEAKKAANPKKKKDDEDEDTEEDDED